MRWGGTRRETEQNIIVNRNVGVLTTNLFYYNDLIETTQKREFKRNRTGLNRNKPDRTEKINRMEQIIGRRERWKTKENM